jgi:hydroxyacylglutathione hydrolase
MHASMLDTLPARVERIPALQDNYIFVVVRGSQALVVDPAVAAPVRLLLEREGLELAAVLQTHHHADHIGGTPELLHRWPAAAVLANRDDRARIPFQTQGVGDGERLALLDLAITVLGVPGHTSTHLAYHLPAQAGLTGELFCGDTLFAGGCGRLFEGTPTQMRASLQRLAALPEHTRVWCAHEYTEANLRWAAARCPQDPLIAARLEAVKSARAAHQPTIPSTIGEERATNLFVRAESSTELGVLRADKDNWRG